MGVNLLEAWPGSGRRRPRPGAGATPPQRSDARVLVNGWTSPPRRDLGGTYEFMGVVVRGRRWSKRKDEMESSRGAR